MGTPIPTHAEMRDCTKCGRATRHEPDREGVYGCVDCRDRESRSGNRLEGKQLVVAFGIVFAAGIALWAFNEYVLK